MRLSDDTRLGRNVALMPNAWRGSQLVERGSDTAVDARPEALAIAHLIAEALEAAHELGIIHRDLKPANKPRPTEP